MEYRLKVTPLRNYPIPDTRYEVHPHSPTRSLTLFFPDTGISARARRGRDVHVRFGERAVHGYRASGCQRGRPGVGFIEWEVRARSFRARPRRGEGRVFARRALVSIGRRPGRRGVVRVGRGR